MAFNLCPDDGPPRLWRPVVPGSLGYADGGKPVVSMLLPGNIQLIDYDLLAGLSEVQQVTVLHTGIDCITV